MINTYKNLREPIDLKSFNLNLIEFIIFMGEHLIILIIISNFP